VGTVVVEETRTLPGFNIDPGTKRQVVTVHPADTQTLTIYNTPGTTLTIQKLVTGTKDKPLAGVEFLITDSSGAYVGPNKGIYKTDEFGQIVLSDLKPGTVITAKETATVDGFVLDSTPKSIEIKEGEGQGLPS
ncbi:MAG: prealbumin-like fold domain-containing protein, partial [Lachnospiraceae bacterium]|nr:prealbumin-like fold domain-containing protein [Lachnospiraceae bacterium]